MSRQIKIYCVELGLPEGDHLSYHIITFEGYRQTTSVNAFFVGHKKYLRDEKRGILWEWHSEKVHEWYTTGAIASWEENREDDTFEHASIWDFYKHIGYEYKTKKWKEGGR